MPQSTQLPSGQHGDENFVCLLEDNARRLSAKPALVWDGGVLSWAELDQRASGFAHFLAAKGAGPGDRIATLIPNHWSFAVALLGILKLGATAATLHPTLKPEELAEVMADLQPRLLVEDASADPSTGAPALAGGARSEFRPTGVGSTSSPQVVDGPMGLPVRLKEGSWKTARFTSAAAVIVYT
ncbi:MAG TPA: class I adenylate-forming enzyme family protein, partial [Candidatus Binatia bacterium]|nr:class I adenylate-forming enzyme family protein [Candidatus Binatia bacterium]